MTPGLVENQQPDRLLVLPDRANENAVVTNRLMVIERDGRDCGG